MMAVGSPAGGLAVDLAAFVAEPRYESHGLNLTLFVIRTENQGEVIQKQASVAAQHLDPEDSYPMPFVEPESAQQSLDHPHLTSPHSRSLRFNPHIMQRHLLGAKVIGLIPLYNGFPA